MPNYGNFEYNIKYLVNRYGIKRQSVQWYIDKYKDEINADQIHIKKIGKEWRFTAQAVNILDGIVGYVGDSVAVADYESAETARIKELERLLEERDEQIDELNLTVASREATIRVQSNLLTATNEKLKKAEADALQLSTAKSDLAKAEADSQQKDLRIEALEARAMSAEAELQAERSKGFFDRLKDLFRG